MGARWSLLLVPLVVLCAAAASAAGAGAAEPYLVRDINQVSSPASSYPGFFGGFGEVVTFTAGDEDGGGLWRSDGTEGGTYRLLGGCPGPCFAYSTLLASNPLGSFYFMGADNPADRELWITRGNAGDTVQLATGLASSAMPPAWVPELGVLFFTAIDDAAGFEPWVTDGTPAGTRVLDVEPGPLSSAPASMVAFAGHLFFLAQHGGRMSLWTSDRTARGTRLVKSLPPGSVPGPLGGRLTVVGKRLVFFAPTPRHGVEPWTSDGTTPGTTLLADLAPGRASSTLLAMRSGGGRAFFVASTQRGGQELWVTNGTGKGTRQLTYLQPAEAFAGPFEPLADFGALTSGRIVFSADDGLHGIEPWVSDGTVKGTRMLRDVCPGLCGARTSVVGTIGPLVIFSSWNHELGWEPWITDGTPARTRLLADLCPGNCASWPRRLGAVGGRVLFVMLDAVGRTRLAITDGTPAGTLDLGAYIVNVSWLESVTSAGRVFFAAGDQVHGTELWRSDGSAAGTQLVRDVDDGDLSHSFPRFFRAAGDRLYFFANDGVSGQELWWSDGTETGTRQVADLVPGVGGLHPTAAAVLGGKLLFTNFDSGGGGAGRLWRTDGTAAGTFPVTPDTWALPELAAAGDLVYFTGFDGSIDMELWRTDGTAAGTVRVADIDPLGDSRPRQLTGWKGTLFFGAHTELGFELWRSDGTAAGTVLVKDLVPGGDSSFPSGFVAGATSLFFVARSPVGETELWRTDGTGPGTQRVAVLSGESFDHVGYSSRIVPLGGQTLVFTQRVWVTDGTQAGTRTLATVGSVDAVTTRPFAFGGAVYFAAAGPTGTRILWRTDGSETGTYPLLDGDGNTFERPASLRTFDGRLVFAPHQGRDFLWTLDGTAAGTRKLTPLGSTWELAVAGPRLFFTAPSREKGEELWALPAD